MAAFDIWMEWLPGCTEKASEWAGELRHSVQCKFGLKASMVWPPSGVVTMSLGTIQAQRKTRSSSAVSLAIRKDFLGNRGKGLAVQACCLQICLYDVSVALHETNRNVACSRTLQQVYVEALLCNCGLRLISLSQALLKKGEKNNQKKKQDLMWGGVSCTEN